MIGDSVLSLNLLKYSSLVASAHGFKSDEEEVIHDVFALAPV